MSRLYRGYNGKSPLANHGILWLTDSKSYAKNFGNKIAEFEIDDSKVDCPIPKELYKLAGCSPKSDTEGFYELMFSPTKEFIKKLKDQQYNSYAFDDDEYHAVILALFDTSIVKLTKSMSQKSIRINSPYDKSFATVDNLPDVKTIRHYTTMSGLAGILKDKRIKANESAGDADWSHMILQDKNVVSFLDSRADSEMESCIQRNKFNGTLNGYTSHLALHMNKICACIEIDYDKLEPYLERKMRTLNELEQSVHNYVERWNEAADRNLNDLRTVEWITKKLLNLKKEEVNKYRYNGLWHHPTEAAVELVESSPYKLNEEDKDWIYKYKIPEIINYVDYPNNTSYQRSVEEASSTIKLVEQYKPKKYTKQEEEDLKVAVGTYNAIDIIHILRMHGWHKDMNKGMNVFPIGRDNSIGLLAERLLEVGRGKYVNNKWVRINESGRGSRALKKMIPEMRIPCDVPISPDYCKIIIFEGMVKGTKSTTEYDRVKSLLKGYNVEIYPEKSDTPNTVKTMSQIRSIYFSGIRCFATYGGGAHHTVVAHKDGGGKWRAEVIDEDYRSVREAFKNTDPEKETYKVYRLD